MNHSYTIAMRRIPTNRRQDRRDRKVRPAFSGRWYWRGEVTDLETGLVAYVTPARCTEADAIKCARAWIQFQETSPKR